jgi:hypothetical protein
LINHGENLCFVEKIFRIGCGSAAADEHLLIFGSTTETTEITEKPQRLQLDGALKTVHPA